MKKFLFFVLGLILGVAIIWGIVTFLQNNTPATPTTPALPANTEVKSEKLESISVSSPYPDQEISSPISIEGHAKGTWFFEAVSLVKVVDEKGTELGTGNIKAVGNWMTEDFVPFKGQITFNKSSTTKGFLIFEKSNPSGLKENAEEFKLPINFKEENGQIVKVFFSNTKKDPELLDCTKVYPLERKIDSTQSVAQKALEELLKGPTSAEKTDGYFTSINTGVKINKLSITNGTAYVDFNEMLQQGVGGSCKTSNIIAQIKETLKQFSSVKEVKISINGESELILQP